MIKKIILILFTIAILLGLHQVYITHTKPRLKQQSFNQLPGWQSTKMRLSLQAFQTSCKVLLKMPPNSPVGTPRIPMTAKNWHPVCLAAKAVDSKSNEQIKLFFETWFTPVTFYKFAIVKGLFTGYYVPLLHGSLTPTKQYSIPIYSVPDDLIHINLALFDDKLMHKKLLGRIYNNQLVPYYTRQEINQGAILQKTKVIAWVDSTIDRLFLEIQGSGIIQLTDGSRLFVGYGNQNGARYTPIAKILIKKGVMTFKNQSMQGIRAYLESHPNEIDMIINQNKSFVFFKILKNNTPVGTKDIALTPGYSLAIDPKWIPIGAPIWLNTTRPTQQGSQQKPLQRLLIAQDTGGAIRGPVRGDVFWGAGQNATEIAGRMKNVGQYWILLPKNTPIIF